LDSEDYAVPVQRFHVRQCCLIQGSKPHLQLESQIPSRGLQEPLSFHRSLNQIDTVTAIEPIDFDQLQSLDAKFHLTIVGIAGNRFINQTLNVLQDVMRMSMETTLRLPGRSEISRNEHNEILKAIESGDGDLASKLTLQHITGARATALADAKKKDNN
jgi:GntR family transcriptional repressor for pyruvate dehydrogenase complex